MKEGQMFGLALLVGWLVLCVCCTVAGYLIWSAL